MNLIKSSLLSFSAFCLVAFTACGNSNAVNKQVKSSAEVTQSSQPEQPAALSVSNSKIQAELEKAKKEGKAVFVVVTGTDVTETDKATTALMLFTKMLPLFNLTEMMLLILNWLPNGVWQEPRFHLYWLFHPKVSYLEE
jgi:hypothetical protein